MRRWGGSLLDLLCSFLGVMYLLTAASSRPEGIAEVPAGKPWFTIVATIKIKSGDPYPDLGRVPKGVRPHFYFVGQNTWIMHVSGQGDPEPFVLVAPGQSVEQLRVCGELCVEDLMPVADWKSLPMSLRGVSAWGEELTRADAADRRGQ